MVRWTIFLSANETVKSMGEDGPLQSPQNHAIPYVPHQVI